MSTLALDNTLGVGLVALVVAATLNGVSIAQAMYYYTHPNDGWRLKLLVGVVVAFSLIHQALITHTVYWYIVTNWGNPAELPRIVWSDYIQSVFAGLVAFLVQSFFAFRVWHLSTHNKLLTCIIAMLVLGLFVTNNVTIGLAFRAENFVQLAPILPLIMSCNALSAAGDLLITASLCFFLHGMRTGLRRSDTMIKKLILFTLETGVIVSVFAVASLISLIVASHTFFNEGFFWCMSHLYTNSLLATLNSRERFRALGYPSEVLSLSLSDYPNTRSQGITRPVRFSLRMNTAKESSRGEQLDSGVKKTFEGTP